MTQEMDFWKKALRIASYCFESSPAPCPWGNDCFFGFWGKKSPSSFRARARNLSHYSL